MDKYPQNAQKTLLFQTCPQGKWNYVRFLYAQGINYFIWTSNTADVVWLDSRSLFGVKVAKTSDLAPVPAWQAGLSYISTILQAKQTDIMEFKRINRDLKSSQRWLDSLQTQLESKYTVPHLTLKYGSFHLTASHVCRDFCFSHDMHKAHSHEFPCL